MFSWKLQLNAFNNPYLQVCVILFLYFHYCLTLFRVEVFCNVFHKTQSIIPQYTFQFKEILCCYSQWVYNEFPTLYRKCTLTKITQIKSTMDIFPANKSDKCVSTTQRHGILDNTKFKILLTPTRSDGILSQSSKSPLWRVKALACVGMLPYKKQNAFQSKERVREDFPTDLQVRNAFHWLFLLYLVFLVFVYLTGDPNQADLMSGL